MSSLTFIVLWSAAIGADGSDSYTEAHRQAMQNNQPMMVMVSTDWCVPCQMMKKTVIPQVKQRGLLRRVVFAIVNPDHDRDLAMQLTGGGPVPQLVMFRKTPEGWMRRKLIGGQSVENVEEFINQGIGQDVAGTKAAPEKQPSETAKKAPAKAEQHTSATNDQVAAGKAEKTAAPVVAVSQSAAAR